jgi:hypothetical protein
MSQKNTPEQEVERMVTSYRGIDGWVEFDKRLRLGDAVTVLVL